MNLSVGILKTPGFVRPALLVAYPIVVLSNFIAKTKYYKIAGIMSISATFIICFLLIFILETESYYRHTALIWLTVTVFMGSIWMTFQNTIYLTVIQLIFAIFVAIFGKNMDLSIFASWMPLNIFFCIINLSTRWVLEQYHIVVKDNAVNLERVVDERTQELQAIVLEREELLKELYHRTKNNMQVIGSLLVIQSSLTKDPKLTGILKETRSRILSMAMVHEKLYGSKDLHYIQIREYITDLAKEIYKLYMMEGDNLELDYQLINVKVPLEKAVPIGLVLHELLVNAFKYAPSENSITSVVVSCQELENKTLRFSVEDNGPGFDNNFDPGSGQTLGTMLVKNIVEKQLGGKLSFETSNGAKVNFELPALL